MKLPDKIPTITIWTAISFRPNYLSSFTIISNNSVYS